jgi:hypothetical protein
MLADAATVAEGKLYVHGGAWDVIYAQAVPTTHASLAVALVLEFEWSETHIQRNLQIALFDEDDSPLGVGAVGAMTVGHPPGVSPGSQIAQPIAIPFPGITFPRVGRYCFKVSMDDQELTRIRFAIRTPPQLPAVPPGPTYIPPTL